MHLCGPGTVRWDGRPVELTSVVSMSSGCGPLTSLAASAGAWSPLAVGDWLTQKLLPWTATGWLQAAGHCHLLGHPASRRMSVMRATDQLSAFFRRLMHDVRACWEPTAERMAGLLLSGCPRQWLINELRVLGNCIAAVYRHDIWKAIDWILVVSGIAVLPVIRPLQLWRLSSEPNATVRYVRSIEILMSIAF